MLKDNENDSGAWCLISGKTLPFNGNMPNNLKYQIKNFDWTIVEECRRVMCEGSSMYCSDGIDNKQV